MVGSPTNWKGLGKKPSWPHIDTIQTFAWRGWQKTRKYLSVRVAGVPAEIRSEYLPKTSVESYRYVIRLDKFYQSTRRHIPWHSMLLYNILLSVHSSTRLFLFSIFLSFILPILSFLCTTQLNFRGRGWTSHCPHVSSVRNLLPFVGFGGSFGLKSCGHLHHPRLWPHADRAKVVLECRSQPCFVTSLDCKRVRFALLPICIIIATCMIVTIDGVWIGDSIYWPLTHSAS
jgi:hypothetical protein